jgi:hypothetical protein
MSIKCWPPSSVYIPTGVIDRADLTQDLTSIYGIDLQNLKNDDGSTLAAAAAAGKFGIVSAGMGTGTATLNGEAASGNSKTSTAMFLFTLPVEYVAAGAVTLSLDSRESVGAATVATTFSCEAYESDGRGAVGINIAGAPSITDITASWQTTTSAITATGLVAGDILTVFIRLVCNDTGGAVGTIAQVGKVRLLLTVKG